MKIAIFSDTFFPHVNGVAGVAYTSAKALAEAGHEVIVFTPSSRKNKKIMEKSGPFKVVFLPSLPVVIYPGERLVFPFAPKAWYILRNFRPDIIHSHSPFGAGWIAVAAAKRFKAKLVGTHHTFFDHYLKHIWMDYSWGRFLSWKYTVAYYNRCDAVVSPTQALGDGLVRHGLDKPLHIIVNPIDTDTFSPASADEKKAIKEKFGLVGHSIVYMGRLSYEKNIDEAIRAFEMAHEKNPDLTLMIVGDGPEREVLENQAIAQSISSYVIFTGVLRSRELAQALQANDAFITASKSENMPLSILEAESCGLPILGISENGIREMVREGENGYLSPADDTDALAANITRVFEEEQRLAAMSKAARTEAEKYSIASVTKLFLDLYYSLTHHD